MIPVARPWLDERDADAARRAILSGWVTQGPEVAAFEREFAVAVGARFASNARHAGFHRSPQNSSIARVWASWSSTSDS